MQPGDWATEEAREQVGARQLRLHAFWHCAVAQAVVQEVSAGLPAGVRLTRAVWRVVCVAAVAAMDKGRRCLWCMHHVRAEGAAAVAAQPRQLRQQTLYEAYRIAPPAAPEGEQGDQQPLDPVLTARRCAVQEFGALLELFVDTLPSVPPLPVGAPAGEQRGNRAWAGSQFVGTDHPFIRRQGPADPPQYVVVLPAQAAAAALAQPPEEQEGEGAGGGVAGE